MSPNPQLNLFYHSEIVTVYLVHIHGKVGRCSHYIGSTKNLQKRVRQHQYKRKSGGSPLLKEASRRGLDWTVAKAWEAPRAFEMRLKRQKNAKRFCPLCNGDGESTPF